MNNRIFGVHWLAFLGILQANEASKLEAAVRAATTTGATMIELACSPVNNLSAKDTAHAILEGGMDTASYCRFLPGDLSLGDPCALDVTLRMKALDTFRADLEFITKLREAGVKVKHITGPSCFALGVNHRAAGQAVNNERIVEFYGALTPAIQGLDLVVNVEYLRPSEDVHTIGGIREALTILGQLDHRHFKLHGDVYHMLENGEQPHETIMLAGDRLGYLHAHGSDRNVPGCFRLDDVLEATDTANWHLIGKALNATNYQGPLVPEPFGADIRAQIQVLAQGLPPAIDPVRYYNMAREHFVRMELLRLGA